MNEEPKYCPFCKEKDVSWANSWTDAVNSSDSSEAADLEEYVCQKCGKSFWI